MPTAEKRSRGQWLWFGAWVLVGAAAALGMISFIGGFVLIPAALIGVFMARRPAARASAFGAVSGAGLTLLAIAYIQRDGPGETCHAIRGPYLGVECAYHLNPLPWLVLGIFLVLGGIVAHLRARPRDD